MRKIAIDGPSGAGKSTLAKGLAKELGYTYVDTGAMYRAIGLYVLRKGIDPKDEAAVSACLDGIKLDIAYENGVQNMYLCGENVTGLIRTSEVSSYASDVSAHPSVRAFLLDAQRNMAKHHDVIMDGRDIGTVILPDADVKLFMTLPADVRAERRLAELLEKGEKITLDEVKKAMAQRDRNDSTRAVAPAVPAKDAIMFDNSSDFETTLRSALEIIRDRLK